MADPPDNDINDYSMAEMNSPAACGSRVERTNDWRSDGIWWYTGVWEGILPV